MSCLTSLLFVWLLTSFHQKSKHLNWSVVLLFISHLAITKLLAFTYQVPVLPHDVEDLLKQQDKSVLPRQYYRKIIQSLFEDMIQFTLYPTTAEYTGVARASYQI
ncbi:uncharacterized protein LOC117100957 [Anneissia japonica]|uniref:uncharacterized protein LOC117100957 n=1 Tax=Anneissia japonica TaxID=1529436 RepID=UPI0014257CC1|nr:uncharacterized protein LOC117100957 [Anneissia japonica]